MVIDFTKLRPRIRERVTSLRNRTKKPVYCKLDPGGKTELCVINCEQGSSEYGALENYMLQAGFKLVVGKGSLEKINSKDVLAI